MNSKRIGNIGEAKTLAWFVGNGIPVYQQFGDNEYADYIVLINNIPLKIQVKTSDTYDGEKVIFDLTSSTAHRKRGVKHKYSVDEVDAFVCYDIQTKEMFLIKNTGNMTAVAIRYIKTKNGQQANINYSSDFSLCVETLHEISQQR